MKGLELSQLYYTDVVKPFLNKEFPKLSERIAAGLVGAGSECYGFDDEFSQDHDWGATVCLWLEEDDFVRFGESLQTALLNLPDRFLGYPVFWIQGRNGVLSIPRFYKQFLKTGDGLKTVGEWLAVPEAWLAAASNGRVFEDPIGKFSAIRQELLLGYPEDIRLKKIAYHCTQIGQAGQYNYPRSIKRQDCVASELALSEFIKEVVAVTFLLNHKYAPFYKWMGRGLMDLEVLGNEIAYHIRILLKTLNKQAEIEEICELLIREFHQQKISGEQDFYMISQAEDIHAHIRMDALRETNLWME